MYAYVIITSRRNAQLRVSIDGQRSLATLLGFWVERTLGKRVDWCTPTSTLESTNNTVVLGGGGGGVTGLGRVQVNRLDNL